MSLLRDIDNILQYGAKTTTYKHATLLAIFDHVIEFPGARPVNNFHCIPAWTPAIEVRFRAHLHVCIQAKHDPAITNDLAYFYKIVYKNPGYDFINGDPTEIEKTLLVHVKNDRAMLEELVPGKEFTIMTTED